MISAAWVSRPRIPLCWIIWQAKWCRAAGGVGVVSVTSHAVVDQVVPDHTQVYAFADAGDQNGEDQSFTWTTNAGEDAFVETGVGFGWFNYLDQFSPTCNAIDFMQAETNSPSAPSFAVDITSTCSDGPSSFIDVTLNLP